MTRADKARPAGPEYPWHTAPLPVPATTGGRAVQGGPAGFVTRALANVVDVAVVVLLLAGGYVAVTAARFLVHPTGFTLPAPGWRTLLLIGLCLQAVYFAVTWAVVGGTVGDRLVGLRVVSGVRTRLRWGRAAVRAVLCTAVPVGLLWVLVSRKNRSAQDVLLRTSVVYDSSAA
jgi:uncharacterized RDD family membrane protein YckC